jgi:transforming growth factor-beta-induced protein
VNIAPHSLRRRRAGLALATVATLSLAAAACGDDDNDSGAADAAADVTSPPPATTAMSGDTTTDMAMAAPSGPACGAVPADGEGSFDGMADDPAATAASNNPVLSTLVGAVDQAGLVDTLNGDGPFTIFAPTNDAFAAVPADQLDAVLADADLLTSVLTYHVVAGEQLSATDLVDAGTVTTVNGADLTVTDVDGTLTINGVPSVCMDVPTANATVHIIGGVLLPPA